MKPTVPTHSQDALQQTAQKSEVETFSRTQAGSEEG